MKYSIILVLFGLVYGLSACVGPRGATGPTGATGATGASPNDTTVIYK